MPTYALTKSALPLESPVDIDETLVEALRPFDLDSTKITAFYPWILPSDLLPEDFSIGLIVGASGSGKSTLLGEFGTPANPFWDPSRAIVSHFASAEDGVARLGAVGLNSAPAWRQPYHTLSTGQKFRADLARVLGHKGVVDEFTSVVDRNVAASASRSVRAWADRTGSHGLVLASCHRDIIPWLRPDWVVDTDAGTLTIGVTERPPLWYMEHVIGTEAGRIVLR